MMRNAMKSNGTHAMKKAIFAGNAVKASCRSSILPVMVKHSNLGQNAENTQY